MKKLLTILSFVLITLLANKAVAQSNYSDFNTPPVAVTIVPAPSVGIGTGNKTTQTLSPPILSMPHPPVFVSSLAFTPATLPPPVMVPAYPGIAFAPPPTFLAVPPAAAGTLADALSNLHPKLVPPELVAPIAAGSITPNLFNAKQVYANGIDASGSFTIIR